MKNQNHTNKERVILKLILLLESSETFQSLPQIYRVLKPSNLQEFRNKRSLLPKRNLSLLAAIADKLLMSNYLSDTNERDYFEASFDHNRLEEVLNKRAPGFFKENFQSKNERIFFKIYQNSEEVEGALNDFVTLFFNRNKVKKHKVPLEMSEVEIWHSYSVFLQKYLSLEFLNLIYIKYCCPSYSTREQHPEELRLEFLEKDVLVCLTGIPIREVTVNDIILS